MKRNGSKEHETKREKERQKHVEADKYAKWLNTAELAKAVTFGA